MFHDKLRHLREHQELSQKEVSERLGIARTTYNRYETGQHEPDFDTLRKIAGLFHVSIDYLLEYGDELTEADKLVDLNEFVRSGNYTVYSRFLTQQERRRLDGVIRAMFEEQDNSDRD